MNFVFDNKISDFLKLISKCAYGNDVCIYFVGGIVRDNILNKPLKDIDLIVNSNAIKFAKKLPCEIKIKSIHEDFCTVKVCYKDLIIDIASTRTEHYPYAGCLPVVDKMGVDIEKDYLRRDFTINALYCKIKYTNDELKYELIDLCNGVNDIKNKTLRALHDKSYIDDPTRILRGVDFKYRFDFDFSKNDKRLINEALNVNPNEHTSTDRIISVFKKIVNEQNFKEIVNNDYFKIINKNDIDVDFDFICKMNLELNSEFYLDVILDNPVQKIEFKSNTNMIDKFSKLSNSQLAYYLYKTRDLNVENFLKWKDIKLLVNGTDLIGMGFEQNKNIGVILRSLLEEKIKNPNNFLTKSDEIFWIKNNFKQTIFP